MDASTEVQTNFVASLANIAQIMQTLNHTLPIKLDINKFLLWKTQMENVIYANGFEDHIEELIPCPPQAVSSGNTVAFKNMESHIG